MIGLVADWIGPINTYILVFVLAGAVQLALWLTATSFAQICVFSIVFGLVSSLCPIRCQAGLTVKVAPGFIGLIPQIVVQLFGPTNLASNVGMVLLFLGPPNMLNGPIGGALYDASGKTTLKWVIVTAGVLQMSGGTIAMYGAWNFRQATLSEADDQPSSRRVAVSWTWYEELDGKCSLLHTPCLPPPFLPLPKLTLLCVPHSLPQTCIIYMTVHEHFAAIQSDIALPIHPPTLSTTTIPPPRSLHFLSLCLAVLYTYY